ncbi:zinc finger CCCH domain-containing protein 25-like [Typha latifolia]|uniref:zinc finger CCCH domain-containing protein 25-like n=1 Tax=Typha latifolia TaxID=4733 RepID=UPI003C308F3B
MNPLTLVKRTQKINLAEAALGISEEASWHAKYKDSAYIFVGGIPFDLTEGDLLAVFAQYGEIVDVNLVRDKGTGKSKGFAFLAYEDQRSTILAVDNLNGAKILGRIVRVDHVTNYKKKEEVDQEKEQNEREARGVCRAFQRGECNRGAACKFSHDEQRSANTGWGPKDGNSRWENDRYRELPKSHKNFTGNALEHREDVSKSNSTNKDGRSLKSDASASKDYVNNRRSDWSLRSQDKRGNEKLSEISRNEGRSKDYGREEDWGKALNQDNDQVRQGEGGRRKHNSSFHHHRKEDDEYYKKTRR